MKVIKLKHCKCPMHMCMWTLKLVRITINILRISTPSSNILGKRHHPRNRRPPPCRGWYFSERKSSRARSHRPRVSVGVTSAQQFSFYWAAQGRVDSQLESPGSFICSVWGNARLQGWTSATGRGETTSLKTQRKPRPQGQVYRGEQLRYLLSSGRLFSRSSLSIC